jgi:DNA sulfur modification protein DndB
MIENVHPIPDLRAVSRRKRRRIMVKSVALSDVDLALEEGWTTQRLGKRAARMTKPKPIDVWLEDRVWTVLYRMGFTHMSGEGGARLIMAPKDPKSPTNQLDVVAIDHEVALAVECKTRTNPSRKPLQSDLAKQAQMREAFSRGTSAQFPGAAKRYTALAFFTENVLLSSADRKRAQEQQQLLFDEADLAYYEALVSHLGVAARYQFLADLLPGKRIPALALRVPALKSRIGAYNCYTFSTSPDYLLKVAYVSHRAKGKASDVNTYQRMIQRTRLRKIRAYITDNGIFPTNIVISFEKSRATRFERVHQQSEYDASEIGWLTLTPAYKSAWVIDGQHRLYAYSGHPRASRSVLSVLAFDGLPPSIQAKLFIDINAEQKSVKQTLLQELYAELHWDADDDQIRARAIISKAIQILDDQPESPFYQRVLKADSARTPTRCISLASLFDALDKTGIYFSTVKKGKVIDHGPLWAGDNTATLDRTVDVLNSWFMWISDRSNGWWDLGAGEGGGLAMNDGVSICIDVLRSVFTHLEGTGHRLLRLDDHELIALVQPFGEALGDYLGSLAVELRKSFRDLRGNQGKAAGLRRCQSGIHQRIDDFSPAGLDEWIELEKARTSETAASIILRIERQLQSVVLSELKEEFGHREADWWFKGVPKSVRKQVDDRINEDQGKRGGREENLDLIHYRDIATHNWPIFGDLLAYGHGSKDRKTAWIADVNEVRKSAMHASRSAPVTLEQLARLEEYERWLTAKAEPDGVAESSDDESAVADAPER